MGQKFLSAKLENKDIKTSLRDILGKWKEKENY
jgi:hypothetical protein